MNRFVFILILFLACSPALADEIKISPGQSLSIGDTTVTCRGASPPRPIELRDCQHWDKFNRACLYEKKTYVWKERKCENSCQIWDEFNSICLYEAKCRFVPGQELFVRSTCTDYDRFNKVCRRASDELIR